MHHVALLFASTWMVAAAQYSVPPIHHGWYYADDYDHKAVSEKLKNWDHEQVENVWEHSGLLEGDIMVLPKNNAIDSKNVVRSSRSNWPNALIPYVLQEGMTEGEKAQVMQGMALVSERSCLKFRPYQMGDPDYVHILYNLTGCWAMVGRQGGGQTISLQRNGCFKPTVVAHELLHVAGLLHQHSAPDRDDFVFVNFTNVKPGRERQFEKFSSQQVTDFGVGYDYLSVMHYSRKAFSKNGEDTITPLQANVEIGQKRFVSDKDYQKLNLKYKCSQQQMMQRTGAAPYRYPRPYIFTNFLNSQVVRTFV